MYYACSKYKTSVTKNKALYVCGMKGCPHLIRTKNQWKRGRKTEYDFHYPGCYKRVDNVRAV